MANTREAIGGGRVLQIGIPAYDMAEQIQQGLRQGLEDDLLPPSPCSSPEATPENTPRTKVAELPEEGDGGGISDQERDGEGEGEGEGSGGRLNAGPGQGLSRKERQKRRNKQQGHRNRQKRARVEKGQGWSGSQVREAAPMKRGAGGRVIFGTGSSAESSVSKKGYTALKGKTTVGEDRTLGGLMKRGYKVVPWDGRETTVLVDKDLRIVAIMAGRPGREEEEEDWEEVCKAAGEELCQAGRALGEGKTHRRGEFQTLVTGFSFGGGQKKPCNFSNSPRKAKAVEGLNEKRCFRRIAGFGSSVFKSWAPRLFDYYDERIGRLLAEDKELKRPFRSVFPAVTYNLGPRTVCRPHVDFANLPFGYCAVTALGRFDSSKGGHMVMDEYRLVLEFPAGSSMLLQSAIVTHSNVGVGEDECRYSVTQYAAGGLFRWVDNGFQTAAESEKGLTVEEREKRASIDAERWKIGLGLVPRLYD